MDIWLRAIVLGAKEFANSQTKCWNFCNFGITESIPKSLVTLRFSKISLHELKISCKTFQMRHWPNFYFDPAYSNTWLTCNATCFKTNAHDWNRNPGKVAFLIEYVTETSGTSISINFISTVWNIKLVGGVCSQKTKWC